MLEITPEKPALGQKRVCNIPLPGSSSFPQKVLPSTPLQSSSVPWPGCSHSGDVGMLQEEPGQGCSQQWGGGREAPVGTKQNGPFPEGLWATKTPLLLLKGWSSSSSSFSFDNTFCGLTDIPHANWKQVVNFNYFCAPRCNSYETLSGTQHLLSGSHGEQVSLIMW